LGENRPANRKLETAYVCPKTQIKLAIEGGKTVILNRCDALLPEKTEGEKSAEEKKYKGNTHAHKITSTWREIRAKSQRAAGEGGATICNSALKQSAGYSTHPIHAHYGQKRPVNQAGGDKKYYFHRRIKI